MKHPLPLLLQVLIPCAVAVSVGAGCTRSPDDGAAPTASAIKHLVVIVQENHTFDNYFGRYCTAAPGSGPSCQTGPGCCESAPANDPGTGSPPVLLTDVENAAFSPNHYKDCELAEINGGKMDGFIANKLCGNPRNFAIAPVEVAGPYWQLAASSALADHYFQPIAGASSANDMYLARARFVFTDNQVGPESIGARCGFSGERQVYTDQTIGDLLVDHGVTWAFYAEGYDDMAAANQQGKCPAPPASCAFGVGLYPCIYDPSDIPFQYYAAFVDNPVYMRDLHRLTTDLQQGTLPAVSYVKALGYKSEHPGADTSITDGTRWVTALVEELLGSQYGATTLILLVYDEGGGYFDHLAPPPTSASDGQPYGTRLPFLAIGPFARRNHVAHTVLEHSSIVKFIEWNWLAERTGQLGNRDVSVNNLGALLDPARTGTAVPAS